MKFQVDVTDFWLDENELSTELALAVKRDVVAQINNEIKAKVDAQILKSVRELVDKQVKKTIEEHIEVVMKDGPKLPGRYSGDPELTIGEYVKKAILDGSGWNSPKDQIAKLAKELGAEIKNRYDLLFASQIVIKMNEQGLLKAGVAESLIPENTEGK